MFICPGKGAQGLVRKSSSLIFMENLFYSSPCILQEVKMELESDILAGSVVSKSTKIETAGQQVETRDFSDVGFNSTWE